ncbi:hypothetical protein ABXT08_08620 [Chryseobacterium sp. NRRL B-14859]|uniref:hypothetical protein n=1 Tax=Chryseobacterium sp. NRRL B-14859 TaxID=1562763 RepID=UPI00339B28CE
MMKIKNILSRALVFSYCIIQAQYIPNVSPPSSNAYSLYKVKEIEIDKMTGTANFSIPIFEIIQDGVNIPINLSYNTGGIKVDERSGSVGLGWTLNIPFDVTKQVHGYDDDDKPLYLPNKNYYLFSNNPDALPLFDYSKINIATYNGFMQHFNLLSALFENSQTGQVYDTQPDMYHYKLGSIFGKFFKDSQLNSRLIPYQPIQVLSFSPLKIQDFESNIYEFVPTLNFLMKDQCSGFSLLNDFYGANNYKVSTITTRNKTNILFKYNQMESNILRNVFEMKNLKIPSLSSDNSYLPEVNVNCETYKEEHHNLLTEISFNKGKIIFKYNTIRNDMEPLGNASPKSLDEILIYDKGDKVIKKIIFSYDYFTSSSFLSNNIFLNKRLKLKSIRIGDEIHEFEYYEDKPIPAINSNTSDYWGYYNGKAANTRIPKIYFKGIVFDEGADRESDATASFTKVMSLKKIKYPTKGTLEIVYENNDYYGEKNIYNRQVSGIESGNPPVFFTLNTQHTNRKLYFTTDYNSTSGGLENGTCIGKIRRKNSMGNYELTGQFTNNGFYPNALYQDGDYKLEISNYGDKKCFISAEYLKEEKKTGTFAAGGLRLKTLNYYNYDSGLVKQKQFRYISDSLGHTSALMTGFPRFISDRMIKVKVGNDYAYKQQYLISSDASYNQSLSPVSSVLYTQVDEFLSDNNTNNGRTKYFNFIDSKFNFTSLTNDFSYGLIDDWKNHTYRTEYYNAQNILQEYNQYIYKTYRIKNQLSSDNYGKYIGYAIHKGFSPPIGFQAMTVDDFNMLPNFQYLLEKISFYGFDSGIRFMAESRNYKILNGKTILTKENREFRNSKELPHLLISNSITDPDGIVTESQYQYAHEKANQLMIDKNLSAIPLETTINKTIGSITKNVSKQETIYPKTTVEITNNSSNLILPLSVKSYNLQDNNSTTEITYDKYDSKGNLQQYTTKDSVSTVIIWGYNTTKPIAKIEGAKLTDIQPSLISAIVSASDTDGAAGANNDETNLLNALNTFRNTLSGYQITTYSYDPLIGVRSITPPSGIRESYIYDAAGRLEKVIDANGKVLKEMKYNYKN